MLGTIVSWFDHRGFGFIRPDNIIPGEKAEIFVHITDTPNQQPIPTNSRVVFDLAKFGGRTKADNVQIVDRKVSDTGAL